MLTQLGADNGMTFWPLPGVRYLWQAFLLAAMSSCPLPPSAFTLPMLWMFQSEVKWSFDLTSLLTFGSIISTTPWEGCECGWSSHQDPNVLFYSADWQCFTFFVDEISFVGSCRQQLTCIYPVGLYHHLSGSRRSKATRNSALLTFQRSLPKQLLQFQDADMKKHLKCISWDL